MRERRPEDWVVDLGGRHRLEDRFAAELAAHPDLVLLRRATASLDELDYAVVGPGDRLAHVELKAKHQTYQGWTALRPTVPEPDLFILDELALRKMLDGGRYTWMAVADRPSRRWLVWSLAELVLASKVRTTRRLDTGNGPGRTKAKLLLDLREAGTQAATAKEAVAAIAAGLGAVDRLWTAIEPWPHGPAVHPPTHRRTS